MISAALIRLYGFVHGKLHLPGAGWLIRRFDWLPGLQSYPLKVDGVGVARLDFRDGAAFSMLNLTLGDFSHDLYLFRTLEKILNPGDILWDVGANVGTVSSYFAHPRFQLSELHSFEPNPTPLNTLRSLLTNHPSAKVHPFGLGNKDETVSMDVSSGETSCTGTIKRDLDQEKSIQIHIRNGDNFRDEFKLGCPNVIKIDVEGFEPDVFAGIGGTIAQCRPVIIFEHIWLSDDQVKNIIPENYLLAFIHDDGVISKEYDNRRKGHDAILLPQEKESLIEMLRSAIK